MSHRISGCLAHQAETPLHHIVERNRGVGNGRDLLVESGDLGFVLEAVFHLPVRTQVMNVTREQRRPVGASAGDHDLHGKLGTVTAQSRELDALTQNRSSASRQIAPQSLAMRFAQPFRNDEYRQLPADHRGSSPSEHLLGRLVELDDSARVIHGDDGIRGRGEHRTRSGLGLLQGTDQNADHPPTRNSVSPMALTLSFDP